VARISARAQRHNELVFALQTCSALVERRPKIDERAMRALRSACLHFLDEVDPKARQRLGLSAQPYERRRYVEALGKAAFEKAQAAAALEGQRRPPTLRGRVRSWSEFAVVTLIGEARGLGLIDPDLRVNGRARIRLIKALENKRLWSKLRLAKLVLEAAGVPSRQALDWTKRKPSKRKSK
jgi:hypothetical protein